MTVSLKRARQRAKTLAADGGMTHQQALDAVARDEGFGTWSAMRDSAAARPATVSAPRPSIDINPLNADLLSRGEDVRREVSRLIVSSLDYGSDPMMRIVAKVFVEDRIAGLVGGRSVLGLDGPSLADGVAALTMGWSEAEAAEREEASKSGGFHVGHWTVHARAALLEAATSQSLPASETALLRTADADVLSKTVRSFIDRMSGFEATPLRLFEWRTSLPADFLIGVAATDLKLVSLSRWEADVAVSVLRKGADVDDHASPVGQVVSVVRRHLLKVVDAEGLPDVVPLVVRVREDEGIPFPDIVSLPDGEGHAERWIRSFVSRRREGLSPFSFNPFAEAALRFDREGIRANARLFTGMVMHGRMAEDASVLIADAAMLLLRAGDRLGEIGMPGISPEVTVSNLYELVSRNFDSMDEVSLFASLNGVDDVSGFDLAARDQGVAEVAARALQPFA